MHVVLQRIAQLDRFTVRRNCRTIGVCRARSANVIRTASHRLISTDVAGLPLLQSPIGAFAARIGRHGQQRSQRTAHFANIMQRLKRDKLR